MLNHEDIKLNNLIQNADNNNFRNASYDLRVDKIITIEGKEVSSFKIKPNSMAVAISKERVKLPNYIIGHAYVKTRLSQFGIMANNIGLIDTEYEGQLSSVLVNFGKDDYEIKEGDSFLRITFTKILAPVNSIPINYGPFSKDTYLNMRKSDSMSYLGNSFVNIDKVTHAAKTEIQKSLAKTALTSGIWIAAAALILTAVALFVGLKDDKINDTTNKKVENLQSQINSFNENQVLLLDIQKEFKNNVVSLEKQVDSISRKNSELNQLIDNYKHELKKYEPHKGK